jgi:hypothetical protein
VFVIEINEELEEEGVEAFDILLYLMSPFIVGIGFGAYFLGVNPIKAVCCARRHFSVSVRATGCPDDC